MDEAFLARQTLDKCAEVLDPTNDATVGLTHDYFSSAELDFLDRAIHCFFIGREDENATAVVFVDIDLCAGDFSDATDVLTTRADEGADLLGVDLDCVNARGMLTEIRTAFRKVLTHDGENLHTGDGILLDCFEGDVEGQALNL